MATIDPSPQRYVKDPNVHQTCPSCKGTVVTTDCEVSRQREENARLKAQLEAAEKVIKLFSNPRLCDCDLNIGDTCDCAVNAHLKYEKLKAGAGSASQEESPRRISKGSPSRLAGAGVSPATPQACTITAEELAECFHEAYEKLAPKFNYKTREASAVYWREIPENNRKLMEATCREILLKYFTPQTCKQREDLFNMTNNCIECKYLHIAKYNKECHRCKI